jgi:hypothetical protein
MYKGKSMPSFEEMERLATEMGHSINQALKYIKNDAPDATK